MQARGQGAASSLLRGDEGEPSGLSRSLANRNPPKFQVVGVSGGAVQWFRCLHTWGGHGSRAGGIAVRVGFWTMEDFVMKLLSY